jgi:predicted membrane-bound dolichyl-phosphate-mannose-protein mannosyltransferase
MNDRIHELLGQISALEDELRTALHEQEHRMFFQIKGKRIEFEQTVRETHRRLKTGFFRWLLVFRPQNLITGPIIYSMIVPMLMLDLCVTFYQATCFPIYRVAKVRRAGYMVFDHHHLAYLNVFEKFHCLYCSYATGLLAYATEIVGRTEQYFCPIKHARKVLASHARYAQFLDYGDAGDYPARVEEFRCALEEKKS